MPAPEKDASKATVERVNGALDGIAQLHKDWDNGFTFHRPDLLERYLDGRIDFHLEFRIGGPSKRDPVDFYAILDRRRVSSDEPSLRVSGSWRKFDSESGIERFIFGDGNDIAQKQSVSHN